MLQPYSLSGLYVITDTDLQPPELLCEQVHLALEGGARLVQYRDKSNDIRRRLDQSRQLAGLCTDYDVPLLINDDIDLAVACGAQGVHLGRDDGSPEQARQILGEQAIIGVSCYNDWQRAADAAVAGVNYIAFGSFFASLTKPDAAAAKLDLLHRAKQQLKLPMVAIGGITPENGARLIEAGADMLAVVQGVFAQSDINRAASRYTKLFQADMRNL